MTLNEYSPKSALTRRAIILGAPGEGKHFLRGVAADINQYNSYLKSDIGGAWFDYEIKQLVNPSKDELLTELLKTNTDYSFIVFAGHGGRIQLNGEDIIDINNNEHIDVSRLQTNSQKQLLIIDSCRTVITMTNSIRESELSKSIKDSASMRKIFDDYLGTCEEGPIKIFSSSIGQAAGEDENGGFFSSSIIKASVEWANASNPGKNILDIRDAFDAAIINMRKVNVIQKPELDGGRRRNYFPFAIHYNAIANKQY